MLEAEASYMDYLQNMQLQYNQLLQALGTRRAVPQPVHYET